jgi:hypothetical protein
VPTFPNVRAAAIVVLLVPAKGVTKTWRAWQVRQQMDAMVSILEQADKEDAAEAAGITGGGDVFLSNDWTLSPQLSAIYDRINTAVSDLVSCPWQRELTNASHTWTHSVLPLIRLSLILTAAKPLGHKATTRFALVQGGSTGTARSRHSLLLDFPRSHARRRTILRMNLGVQSSRC